MTPAILPGPALLAAAFALVGLLFIVAALIVRQHSLDVAQANAAQPDDLEDTP